MPYLWEKQLDFRTFDSLLEVADSGSIEAAANKSTVSTIQRHFNLLEKSFCCKLRENEGKTVKLSDQGLALAKLLREQRLGFLNFKDSCSNLSSVRIAAGDSLLHLVVLPKLAAIQKQFPSCTIHVTDLGTINILQKLNNLSIDLGIFREESLPQKRVKAKRNNSITNENYSLDHQKLGQYKYAVFIPISLLAKKNVTESDLEELPFAMIRNHWGKNFMEMARDKNKIDMDIRVWCETFSQVARLVKLNGYAGILPRFFQEALTEDKFILFEPVFLKNEAQNIVLAWNKGLLKIRSKTLSPFIESVANQLRFD
jgi:DNA-binding transcriptional LysR family regulator